MKRSSINTLFITLCILGRTISSFADEGLLEINQACAVHTGCFAGDAPGFPVTLTEPGSYILTGDLNLPDGVGSVIVINSPNIELDLREFRITGGDQNAYTWGDPAIIQAQEGTYAITLRNGTITPSFGLGPAITLPGEDAKLVNLGIGGGVQCGGNCLFRSVNLWAFPDGVRCGSDCTIRNSVFGVTYSDGTTLQAGSRTFIHNSEVSNFEGGWGLTMAGGIIKDSSAGGDHSYGGIVSGSSVRGQISGNYYGGTVLSRRSSVGPGLMVGDTSSFIDSDISSNPYFETINVGDGTARVSGSTISFSDEEFIFTGNVVDAGGNVCNGMPWCF